jgi:hydroxyacylglutathione hydrolase
VASATEIAKRYFAAAAARDVDAMAACWASGGRWRLVGERELVAPEGVRDYFRALFAAFPDFSFEVVDVTTARTRTAVRWRGRGTFAGPGRFEAFEPNGARVDLEGCDVLVVTDDQIQSLDAYLDLCDLARQLGLLPPAGSAGEARLARLANLRTSIARRMQAAEPERIAEGVWLVRGGFPSRVMNVYLIEEAPGRDGRVGGVTAFDAGIRSMTGALRAAAARLGGLRRVVLGHADADHRGAAPGLHAPIYCHPDELDAAQSDAWMRPYHDLSRLAPHGRLLMPRLLPFWDGGAVKIEGTIKEGDGVAGFQVVELPGHAPGLIGLFRERDRLALASDCVYTVNPQTGIKGPPHVPHPAFNVDTQQARESIRKLAGLEPREAWFGHAEPLRSDVVSQLHTAAAG